MRKVNISFVMSVCPSVLMEHLGCHVKEFHEIAHLIIFRKYVEKFQVSLKSDKNKGYFTWRPINICDHIFSVIYRMRKVSGKKICRENLNKIFIFNNFAENSTVYETMWKNVVESDRSQWRYHTTLVDCMLDNWATDMHSEFIILMAVPLQQWLHERASMLRYTSVVSIVNYPDSSRFSRVPRKLCVEAVFCGCCWTGGKSSRHDFVELN
jgi:hypothetical protein